MLSQQEISDRFEIQDLVFRYAQLVDAQSIDALREVFTEDAHVDYSAMGGSVGNLEETLTFLSASLTSELFPHTQHLNANVQVKVSGDSASGRVMCFNPMEMAMPDGGTLSVTSSLFSKEGEKNVVIRITDTGMGIAEEKLGMIFTPSIAVSILSFIC